MEFLDQLYNKTKEHISQLVAENENLRDIIRRSTTTHNEEILSLRRALQEKDEEIKQLRSAASPIGTRNSNISAPPPLAPPSRLPFTPALMPMSPPKKRQRTQVKQEPSDTNAFQIPEITPSSPQRDIERSPEPLSSPSKSISPHKSRYHLQLARITSSDENLPPAVEDSEFARLPTQYSEQSNLSPIKSQLGLSQRRIDMSSPSKSIRSESVRSDEVSEPQVKVEQVKSVPPPPTVKYEEVVDDSDEEYVLLRPPLADITNVANKEVNPKMTPLQRRDYSRNLLIHKFHNDPHYRIKISLTENPVYQQRWMLSDFEPNPNYIKPKLKRKIGKTRKEQQEIDRFHALAGPGIQLKSLQWDNLQPQNDNYLQNQNQDLSHQTPDISQLFDRFPSPPGFNEVDFPTTQEEQERRLHSEQVQAARIEKRIMEAMRQQSYVFREQILNKYVTSGRAELEFNLPSLS